MQDNVKKDQILICGTAEEKWCSPDYLYHLLCLEFASPKREFIHFEMVFPPQVISRKAVA